jgi:SAM-dependent methyltransferase
LHWHFPTGAAGGIASGQVDYVLVSAYKTRWRSELRLAVHGAVRNASVGIASIVSEQTTRKGRVVDVVTRTAGQVSYEDVTELWQSYPGLVLEFARRHGVTDVAELGGGANPQVGDADKWNFVNHRVVIDISPTELAKAGSDVDTRVADLCQPITEGHKSYDLVFSTTLCEHLADPRLFHENCFNLLRPGGLSIHFYPTLFTIPFAINKLLPERLSHGMLKKIHPGRLEHGHHDKFPAYYRWTTGPTRRAVERFESVGFEVVEFRGTFGHHYYYRIPPLHKLELAKSKFLLRHPAPGLTSYAIVVLRKPESAR